MLVKFQEPFMNDSQIEQCLHWRTIENDILDLIQVDELARRLGSTNFGFVMENKALFLARK